MGCAQSGREWRARGEATGVSKQFPLGNYRPGFIPYCPNCEPHLKVMETIYTPVLCCACQEKK